MLNYDNFAILLARAVELIRSRPRAIEEQKGALRALVALTKLGGATFAFRNDTLLVEGEAVAQTLPLIPALSTQMKAHAIREIRIARGASAADLLSLIRALAAEGGDSATPAISAAGTVAMLSVPEEDVPEGRRPVSVTRAFEVGGLTDRDSADPDAALGGEPVAAGGGERGVGSGASSLRAGMRRLAASPHGSDLRDRLGMVVEGIVSAMRAGDVAKALEALTAVLDHDSQSPAEGDAGQIYDSAIRHVLNQEILDRVVPLLTDSEQASRAAGVVRRAGLDGVDAVVARLAATENPTEARAYFAALEGVRDRGRLLVAMLTHPEPATARNVAELMGDLGFAEAVPALGRALSHEEPLDEVKWNRPPSDVSGE